MASARALKAPGGDVVPLTRALVDDSVAASASNDRRRVVLPFHRTDDELLRRMFNALQPDTYLRPHRHSPPSHAEAWLVLRGAVAFFTFSDDGAIDRCLTVRAGADPFGIDLSAPIFHTLLVLEPDTVLYEVKAGRYDPATAAVFASWAPEEGTPAARAYLDVLRKALAGHG